MEEICNRDNLNQAFRRVVKNKGAAGVDGMATTELLAWLKDHKDEIVASLLEESYKPQPVLRVDIPKPQGGMRQLGIPTCLDRLIQQAILQVIQPIIDTKFSNSSYGFRPRRSAQGAVQAARDMVADGRIYVVDIDLENFFTRVNHDILMSRLMRHISDKRLLRLIRKFLNAGILDNGIVVRNEMGTPQGGPLSPLLANVLLDDLDKELEKRGHKFVRYADDCNIYVHSKAAAERVLQSVSKWLQRVLRLQVNQAKSAASIVDERKFLGYTITSEAQLLVAKQSIERFRKKVIEATKRRTPHNLTEMVAALNPLIRGWLQYFSLADWRVPFKGLDSWIRQRLRAIRIRQCKNPRTILRFLMSCGVRGDKAARIATSSRGAWRLALTLQVKQAMPNKWFKAQGLLELHELWETRNRQRFH
jgi:RNA-directed DNA polymerase